MNKTAPSIFLLGLLFGSGPCLVSCGPLLVSYVAGTRKSLRQGALSYLLFSLAKVSAYLVLSLAVFLIGRFAVDRLLGNFSQYIFILGGVFIVVLGLLVAIGSRLEFKPWQKLHSKFIENDNKSMMVLGLITGLSPCAPLLAILSYLGLISKTWPLALLYGLLFGVGTLLSPLLIVTMCAGLIPRLFLDRNNRYLRIFNFVCGAIVVILGLRLFFGVF
jgi:sulfite exporter TauE/SafE